MDSLTETIWDVVICGTGLQQSLLALGLSRSSKKVLHIDPNEYYGGSEAALSLQEAEAWAQQHSAPHAEGRKEVFSSASVEKPSAGDGDDDGDGGGKQSRGRLSFPRAYSLALCPQIVHARSELLAQLVSSRAYRQLEFLAVGSFYILRPASISEGTAASQTSARPTLVRIPSTREDVFSSTAIPVRAKRALMKFLKFVLDEPENDGGAERQLRDTEPATSNNEPLARLLGDKFGLDSELQSYILALALSLDGKISVSDGLEAIRRHLGSMGTFGPGFAAVYPKWGGLSEVAQVACRAGAVGGTIYMLATGIGDVKLPSGDAAAEDGVVEITLANGTVVKSRLLVRGSNEGDGAAPRLSRLVAVVDSPLKALFEAVVEGAPTPAVAVIGCPSGTLRVDGRDSEYPVHASAHSSETGECPVGQSVVYLSTISTPTSKSLLETCLGELLLAATESDDASPPKCLYQLYYEQAQGGGRTGAQGQVFVFPAPSAALSFQDATLGAVREAWKLAMGSASEEEEYMVFADREGVGDDDEMYD